MKNSLDDVRRELMDLARGSAGYLRVGTGLAMAEHLVPDACNRLTKSAPGITLKVTAGTSEMLISVVKQEARLRGTAVSERKSIPTREAGDHRQTGARSGRIGFLSSR